MTKDTSNEPGSPKAPDKTDPIETALREIFTDIEEEEVPAEFSDLIRQFAQESAKADRK